MEWTVVESRLIAKQLKKAPLEIRKKYVFWRDLVREMGPNLPGGYRVHALHGKRKNTKSARLNRQWRVIYKVFQRELVVQAIELSPRKY